MQDIAMATGAQFISDEIGLDLDEVELDVLGSADQIIITKDDTIIMGGKGDSEEIEKRVDTLEAQVKVTTSEYDKEKLQERLGRLTGGVAIIKVGGSSEVEVSELKDRIEDALWQCLENSMFDDASLNEESVLYAFEVSNGDARVRCATFE